MTACRDQSIEETKGTSGNNGSISMNYLPTIAFYNGKFSGLLIGGSVTVSPFAFL